MGWRAKRQKRFYRLGVVFALCLGLSVRGEAAEELTLSKRGFWQSSALILRTHGGWWPGVSSLLLLDLEANQGSWGVETRLRAAGEGIRPGSGPWEMEWQEDVDRLAFKLCLPALALSLGKQMVNWGVGTIWSPTNLFTPPPPPQAEVVPAGVVAAVTRIPLGPLAEWSVVAARPQATEAGLGSDGQWRYGVRYHRKMTGTDWSLLAAGDETTFNLGADFKGNLAGLGWHGEAVAARGRVDGETRYEGVLGTDYSWGGRRVFWQGEYYYYSPGAVNKADYDLVAFKNGKLKNLGRHYLCHQLNYRYSDFTSFSAMTLTNLGDGGTLWMLGSSFLTGRWKLTLAVTGVAGAGDTEYALVSPANLLWRLRAGYSF